MNLIKLLYRLAGLGLIITIALHGLTYIVPEMSDVFAYGFIGLFVGGICVGVLPLGLIGKRGKSKQGSREKGGAFFRYTHLWLRMIILIGILYGGVHFAFLFLQDHEGEKILEKHNYFPENIVGEELQVYQAYQQSLVRNIFGLFVQVYSFALLLIVPKLYEPVVESFFTTLGDVNSFIVRKIAPLLLEPCKKGTLQPMIHALSQSSPSFRDALVKALRYCGDSRSVLPLLALFEETEPPLQDLLHILLKHSCRYPRIIVFGQQRPERFDHRRTVYNPDVSRLMVSMPHIKHLVIDPATYDFYCVERFLTYAISYIGQPYLKKHVTVHISPTTTFRFFHLNFPPVASSPQIAISSFDEKDRPGDSSLGSI